MLEAKGQLLLAGGDGPVEPPGNQGEDGGKAQRRLQAQRRRVPGLSRGFDCMVMRWSCLPPSAEHEQLSAAMTLTVSDNISKYQDYSIC